MVWKKETNPAELEWNKKKKSILLCIEFGKSHIQPNAEERKKQRIKTDGNKLLGDKDKKKWLKFDWICKILHSKDFFFSIVRTS